jgi:hypothetical protein
MNRKLQGYYKTISTVGEKANAFIPAPLPPTPPIEWTPSLREKFDQAHLALGRLDSVSRLLPDTTLFLYMYVRKEAVLSSMIEGTQSSLSDLLLFEIDEAPGVPIDDVQEVSNYVAALYHGLDLEKELPISLRLFKEIHRALLSKGRGCKHSSVPEFCVRSNNLHHTTLRAAKARSLGYALRSFSDGGHHPNYLIFRLVGIETFKSLNVVVVLPVKV